MNTVTEPAPAETRSYLTARIAAALALSLVAGVATSLLQTVLPVSFASAANSAGTWCLVAFAATLWCASSRLVILVGPASLALLVAGYYATSDARGFPNSAASVGLWLAASVVIGLAIGLSALWLARKEIPAGSLRRAISVAPMPGILIGEGLYGILRLTESTSAVYWGVEIALGGALVVWLVARRVATVRARLIALAGTAAFAAAVFGAYGGYGG